MDLQPPQGEGNEHQPTRAERMTTVAPLVWDKRSQVVQATDIRKWWKENRIAQEKNSSPNMWKQCHQTSDFKGLLQENKMQGKRRWIQGLKWKVNKTNLQEKNLPGKKG